jgi:hypothetical protein
MFMFCFCFGDTDGSRAGYVGCSFRLMVSCSREVLVWEYQNVPARCPCTHMEFLFPFRSNRSLYNVDRDRLATLANQSMRRVISAEVTQGDSCPGISPPQCRISPFHFLPCFLWGLICRVSSRGRSQKVRFLARVQGGRSASRPRTLSWQSRAASIETKQNQIKWCRTINCNSRVHWTWQWSSTTKSSSYLSLILCCDS